MEVLLGALLLIGGAGVAGTGGAGLWADQTQRYAQRHPVESRGRA